MLRPQIKALVTYISACVTQNNELVAMAEQMMVHTAVPEPWVAASRAMAAGGGCCIVQFAHIYVHVFMCMYMYMERGSMCLTTTCCVLRTPHFILLTLNSQPQHDHAAHTAIHIRHMGDV